MEKGMGEMTGDIESSPYMGNTISIFLFRKITTKTG
jgi:hypothetical protein